jgi:hypothetical protein
MTIRIADPVPGPQFAIAKNPCMSKDSDREKLIGYIERMHEVDCALRVIDTVLFLLNRPFSCHPYN